ncbi:MAG: HsdM family class I SAM-dependent methyltransferase [Promethearchaeota archaeon]|jgi:predicted RNA methylase
MKIKEKLTKVNLVFETVLNSIETRNHQRITESLSEFEKIEISFLNEYSNRKNEGAYYTRKSISNFIVSRAIELVLNRFLKSNPVNSLKEINTLAMEKRRIIQQKLLNFSVLDPACGSGVFLLSAAEKIYQLLTKFEPEMDIVKIVTHIIKNIYGSEINENARKLCVMKIFRWAYTINTSNASEIFALLNSNILLEDSLAKRGTDRFNIVIGNPPYGNILDKNQKEQLKSENIFHNDIYCAFILKSLEWTDDIIGYLVPKSFLLRQGYVLFRKNLLALANLLEIYDFGPNLFANATNEVQILFYEKKAKNVKDLKIYRFPNTKTINYTAQKVDSLRICFNKACSLSAHAKKIYVYTSDLKCPYCNSKTTALNRIRIKPNKIIIDLINKIEENGDLNYLNINRTPKMIRGEEDKGLKHITKFIEENASNSCYFIKAKGDFNYYYFTKDKSFNIEVVDPKILKGNNFEFYIKPKLLIKHNNIFPQSIFTKEKVCFTSSIYSVIDDDHVELKYINAILNSSLMQYYSLYGINNQQNTTINLNQYMIRHLPIINSPTDQKNEISNLVQIIIDSLLDNNGNYGKEILSQIREVDKIIFDLYGLESGEREMIIKDIKNRIEYFRNIYA